MVEVRGQKSDLARHHAVRNEVHGDDVLLLLVAKDHLLTTKHNRGFLRHLQLTDWDYCFQKLRTDLRLG